MNLKHFLIAAAAATVVVACGGGGAGSMSSAAGSKPVVATGVITGFGSIYLNGTHYQTSTATIHKNGKVVDQSQLAVGEVARLKASKHTADANGVAVEVNVEDLVLGPISTIDAGNGELTVLAQTIKVNGGTSFAKDILPGDIKGLKVGDVIEVSGLIDSSGMAVATRIDRASASSALQVLGSVTKLDTSAHTFMINALTVDYSSGTLLGFATGAPSNGDLVEVQGTSFNTTTNTLVATQLTRQMTDREEAGGDTSTQTEREGLITRYASATDFDVSGNPVTTTTTTMYRNGSAADLAQNVKVEVTGTLNSSNVLVADVVAFEHNGNVELEAQATLVDAVAGTLTLLGVPITTNSNTRFEDDSAAAVAMFNLSNVTAGDTIKVRGYESPAGSGHLIATRLEREVPSTTVLVVGPFTAASSPDFKVLGITIDASTATLSDGHNGTLSLAAFLTQAVGHGVEVKGTLSGTVVQASEVAIDDHTGDEN